MQDIDIYKITEENQHTVYSSAVLPGNTGLFLLCIGQMGQTV